MINEEKNNKIYIKPLMESIKKYLLLIILITGLVAGSTFFLTKKFVDPKFESVGSMMVEVKVDNPEYTFQDMLSYKNYLSNLIVETIKSDDIVGVAIKPLDFDVTSEQVKKGLTVTLDSNTQLIEIKAHGNSSEKSAKIVSALLEASSSEIPKLFDDTQLKVVNIPAKGKKVSPNLRNATVLSGMFTFVVALGVLFLKFITDTRINDVEQLSDQLNIPVLGSIDSKDKNSFSFLNLNIMHLIQKKTAQSVLITSTLKGDGKSYIAQNLAEEYSRFEKKVLLMNFSDKQTKLSRKGSYDVVSVSSVYVDDKNVDAKKIKEVLSGYKNDYDLIIVDTDAISCSPEAQLLTQICDQTLFVVNRGTDWNKVTSSLQRLEMLDADVMGVVWNDKDNE